MSKEGGSFWMSLPGVLTALAALIGAMTPLILHYQNQQNNNKQVVKNNAEPKSESNSKANSDSTPKIHSKPKPDPIPEKILPNGSVTVFDAIAQQSRSGFDFSEEVLVAWHSGKADVLVQKLSKEGDPKLSVSFFFQYEEGLSGNYSNAETDKNAKSGIVAMQQTSLDELKVCPKASDDYSYHWFEPKEKGVYCIRARDGKHYAKIRITRISRDGITFDWVYQPERTSRF